ncbi:MAG: hypothetical protein NVSMB58_38060 [Terriglobales bacterium]
MKRIILPAACVTTILAVCLSLTFRARAQENGKPYNVFNIQSLNDKYGFHVLALSLDPSNTLGGSNPFAVSGYYEFHGDGTLDGADTVSRNGEIVPRRYNGTYQVNPDGTGTLQLNVSPTFRPVGNFIIVHSGREIEIIFAVPGNLNTFTLRQQHDPEALHPISGTAAAKPE